MEPKEKNYKEASETIKRAYEEENKFLKEEVIDKGAITGEDDNLQNQQSNIERNIE